MSLLDSIVSKAFRDEEAGRVVVFTGDRRNRSYLVRSTADELKIKSFLKMFYFAHLSILMLGMLVANAWSSFVIDLHAFSRPESHMLPIISISLGIYCVFVGLPYFFVWRFYKKAFLNFVSPQDEVSVSGKPLDGQQRIAAGVLVALSMLILIGVLLLLIRHK